MTYELHVKNLAGNAEQMEEAYRTAAAAGESEAFKQAIAEGYAAAPDNLLYAAWYYRLRDTAARAKEYTVAWGWVVPLAILSALLFWWLSGDQFFVRVTTFQGATRDIMPGIVLLAGPLAAVFLLAYLAGAGRRPWLRAVIIGAALLAAAAYVLLVYPRLGVIPFQEQYITLMAMHLPLLAWAGVGLFLMFDHRDADERFAFLIKSLEVFVVGGLFAIAGGLFTAITAGLFAALDVDFPELVQRLFIAGGAGLIVVIAPAVIYNPALSPSEQSFDEGLSKLVALLMRAMLPLALVVLVVYLAFIPFNFRAPFDNREVLVIFNAMLFAVVALLVGATPIRQGDLSPRLARGLRWGLVALAALSLIVSIYALAAIVYRTGIDRLTPNRLTFIGWNVVNIGLLALVLFYQARVKDGRWADALKRAYSAGTVAYAVWTVVVILALPWLFGRNLEAIETLPERIQQLVFEQPEPILLKCAASPHIYLLEDGQKRWIDTIDTFEERGYLWREIAFVSCADLRAVPDGESIPPEAGPPPQP